MLQTFPDAQQGEGVRQIVKTESQRQTFSVDYSFPVIFTKGVFDPSNSVLADTVRSDAVAPHRMLVLVDQGVAQALPQLAMQIEVYARHYAGTVELAAPPVVIEGGEAAKRGLDHVIAIQKMIVDHHIDRHSYIVAVGGGAFLDMVGLAAATAHRGIRHIRVPTTVLSQNDSGVGVKNGINLFGSKNFFGTFAPPFAVLNDLDFIAALPERDQRAGMAEAVKVALIRDRAFFEWLESNSVALARFEAPAMAYMIRRCAQLHMHQIGQGGDPFERGTARPLDFGHWAAHRLELLTEFSVRHGEAVAIGIALDTEYSCRADLLPRHDAQRVSRLLTALGFELWHDQLLAQDRGQPALMRGLADFQEHLGGELTITLLEGIGQGVEVHAIDHTTMMSAVHHLQEFKRP